MAKQRALGADATLLCAFETVYGTAPDGSGGGVYSKMSFKSTAVGAEQPLGTDALLGQGRNAQDPYYEPVTVNGDIVVPVDLRGFGFWLKGVFGAPVTTDNADGTYSHVFTSGGVLPSLSVQTGFPALSVPVFNMVSGLKLGGFQIDMSRSGPVNATLNNNIAQGETAAATSEDATPAEYELQRFSQGTGSVKLGGSQLASVMAGSISFSNNLEAVETIRSDNKIDGADEGEATATGSVTLRYASDATVRDAVAAQTPVAMEFGWSIPGSEGYALTFSLPRVFLPKPKQSIDGPGGISAEYNWQAANDPDDDYMLRATLVNDVESY
ncbi:phage tail tube protein [uncultured Thalassospira sp.]|uniref:phage tail tube protein n=1 Tax=uncultured Thalassospira sp. TaxID=404382 RepID=UPI0030DB833E|tara:strand:+ start:29471 stop:30448 length:978 start_codon:yes stop_codon:yes gene_type:complete